MFKTVFARPQKIKNCGGRKNYLTSEDKQEHLLCTYTNVEDTKYWSKLARETEPGDNHCREIYGELPNSLHGYPDKIEEYIKKIGDQFHEKYGVDFVISCHDNPGNLHFHIMFNERYVINPNATQELKTKVDQARWKVDGKYCKKKEYNQALEEGGHFCEYFPKREIVYIEDKMFSNKERHFTTRAFLQDFKEDLAKINNQIELELGTGIEWSTKLPEGHEGQVHIGKNVTPKIKAEREAYNEGVRERNRLFDLAIPEFKNMAIPQLEDYYKKLLNAADVIKQSIMSMENIVHAATNKAINRFKSLDKPLNDTKMTVEKLKNKKENLENKLEVKEQELEDKYEKQRERMMEHMPKRSRGGPTL